MADKSLCRNIVTALDTGFGVDVHRRPVHEVRDRRREARYVSIVFHCRTQSSHPLQIFGLFSLLISDEAHHAVDNRPYSRIIRIKFDIEDIDQ